jgi:hypothetical protein
LSLSWIKDGEERRKKMTWRVHTSEEKEEDGGVLWTIRKYVGLQMGPTATKTYIMAYFKELKNYNGSYLNG